MIPTLAHGVFFVDTAWQVTIALVMIAKVTLHWLLIWAYRYQVSSDRPASSRRIIAMTGVRAAMGPIVVLVMWLGVSLKRALLFYLAPYLVRVVAWVFVGWLMPLRGKRVGGFLLAGMWIDVVLDVAIVATGMADDYGGTGLAGLAALGLLIGGLPLGLLLVPLCLSSKSPALLARFQSDRVCRKCGYDLTGNATGVCPECGTAIKAEGASEGG